MPYWVNGESSFQHSPAPRVAVLPEALPLIGTSQSKAKIMRQGMGRGPRAPNAPASKADSLLLLALHLSLS